MPSASGLPSYRYAPSLRTRLTALGLSLGVCLAILIVLIRMGALLPGVREGGARLVSIALSPNAPERSARTHAAPQAKAQDHAAAAQVRPVPPPVQPREAPVHQPPAFLQLSRSDFAAADISKMARRPAGGGEAGAGRDSGSAYGPGEGPGGAKLYNAEWYREPTEAEMSTYLPHRDLAGGWAVIACRTEERYRVSDCRELAESPPGSGLSRALRQAAWQFLVRPPRIDGKPVIGAWVRIRFDFTAAVAHATDDPPPG